MTHKPSIDSVLNILLGGVESIEEAVVRILDSSIGDSLNASDRIRLTQLSIMLLIIQDAYLSGTDQLLFDSIKQYNDNAMAARSQFQADNVIEDLISKIDGISLN
jgi:hypothetical protein